MKLAEALTCFEFGLSSGRCAHAYLVVGDPRGEAGVFAERCLQRLFCVGDRKPCGACVACGQVAEHTYPDMMWIEPQLKSRQISIERVRELCLRMGQKPFAGVWKACIIAGADRLNASSANALLKTLEEPAGNSIFPVSGSMVG